MCAAGRVIAADSSSSSCSSVSVVVAFASFGFGLLGFRNRLHRVEETMSSEEIVDKVNKRFIRLCFRIRMCFQWLINVSSTVLSTLCVVWTAVGNNDFISGRQFQSIMS